MKKYPPYNPPAVEDLRQMIVSKAESNPDGIAFMYTGDDGSVQTVTYARFRADVDAVGTYFHEQGIVEGKHVALLGVNSYEWLATFFALVNGGNVVLPLDARQPVENLIRLLWDGDCAVLAYSKEFEPAIPAFAASLNDSPAADARGFLPLPLTSFSDWVREGEKLIALGDRSFIDCEIDVHDMCALVFTSGTTGKPKGVMLSHRALIDNTFCTDEDADSFNQVILNVLPFNHVFCLNCDVFITMRYGSTLCFCGNLNKMLYYINLFQPHFMRVVPMMAKALNSRALITLKQDPSLTPEEAGRKVWGQNLKKLASGGGYLAPELAESLEKFGLQIGQGYGMSECSPKISVAIYDRPDKRKSVGQVVRNCHVKIVDGEIRVKSPSVMMGYYNDPERTRESLTKDGWLCTGDLGYVDREGFLYLTGRKKNLIILENGENVSPESIENLFDGDPLISDILIYEKDHRIAAAVYPNYEYANTQKIKDIAAAVQEKIRMISDTLPTYSRIADVIVRKNPFEKTSSRKIIRSKYFIHNIIPLLMGFGWLLPYRRLQLYEYQKHPAFHKTSGVSRVHF